MSREGLHPKFLSEIADGFIDLMMAGAPELTLEALYMEFAEQHDASYPHWFPESTVKIARAKLDGWPAK